MQYSKSGLELTKRFEGVRLIAYQDSTGVWTNGYGHTNSVKEGDVISQTQAEQFLQEDIKSVETAVNDLVKVSLTQEEFDALVDFVFNLGVGNFERSTLLRLLNQGDYNGAAAEFEKWDKARGKVISGLLRRRIAEENEFIDGTEISS